MVCEDRAESQVCPECGSKLAVEVRPCDGVSIAIAVCPGYPDCTFFYWSIGDSGGGPHVSPSSRRLADWAIDGPLDVLRSELSPEEWSEAISSLGASPETGGGGRG